MYRTKSNMDERAIVFVASPGKKKTSVFYYNFFLGKDNQKISM